MWVERSCTKCCELLKDPAFTVLSVHILAARTGTALVDNSCAAPRSCRFCEPFHGFLLVLEYLNGHAARVVLVVQVDQFPVGL